jgi:hypothetical protein
VQPAHPHFQAPQSTAPGNPNTDLLAELARLQTLFTANQHAVNEQLLNRLPVTQNAGRYLPALKASDIGLFEPAAQPNTSAAILFIDNFNDAVKQYGEDRVLLIMKRCCGNAVALSWLTSLSEDDRNGLLVSIAEWECLLRRDFMPQLADLKTAAKEEISKWSQNRTPTQYVWDKIKFLKIAGIMDPDKVVYELHRSFHRCPELQIPLTQAVKETGDDLAHYHREVLNYQKMAKLQYKFNHRPSVSAYAPRGCYPPAPQSTPADTKGQVAFRKIELEGASVVISLRAVTENIGTGRAR